MKNFDDLATWPLKELRKLKMNLNNRIEKFKRDPDAKELPPGHMLHGLNPFECEKLLLELNRVVKALNYEARKDDLEDNEEE